MAAIVQEKSKKYLATWKRKSTSISEGSKALLSGHSKKTVVLPVDNCTGRKRGFFLILSLDGTVSTFDPLQDGKPVGIEIESDWLPAGTSIADVKVATSEWGTVSVCFSYEGKGLKEVAVFELKPGSTEETTEGEPKLVLQFVSRKQLDVVCGLTEESVFGLDSDRVVNFSSIQSDQLEYLCKLKTPWRAGKEAMAVLSLSSSQLALVGLTNSNNVCLAIVDKDYGCPLAIYESKDERTSVDADEFLIEATQIEQETLLVLTNKSLHCFKLALSEVSFCDLLGNFGRSSNKGNPLVDTVRHKAHVSVSDIPASEIVAGPSSQEYCYEIFERTAPEGYQMHQSEDLGDFDKWLGRGGTAKAEKDLPKKLESLLTPDCSQALSEDFIAKATEKCVALRCWKGLEMLCKHSLLAPSAVTANALKVLVKRGQYALFDEIFDKNLLFEGSDMYDMIVGVLECNLEAKDVQSCLTKIVSRNSTVEVVMETVSKLTLTQVMVLIQFLGRTIKDLYSRAQDRHPSGQTLKNLVLFASCTIDAHLHSIILSEDSYRIVEELSDIIQEQLCYEKAINKLTHVIKDLDRVKPLETSAYHASSADFAVELLNIGVK
eukprot:CAMPEP_0198245372 /NCGR_PEP_ID=MMETSP1446-20131203/40690_1 /TAXON_ID=1461542 ORGANISM="Unidentified sp, Strain CCMP2111" /NCGR_SAMPLE_ID=MMETSP1446 /ASSEMBLY_ACC=CAM_ASM_001112 /LENGTH=603 /DNA_ID=CAMNT_0043929547 /DNA_START=142 /DNA_END=1953 /DNA_ORIENTATION=+